MLRHAFRRELNKLQRLRGYSYRYRAAFWVVRGKPRGDTNLSAMKKKTPPSSDAWACPSQRPGGGGSNGNAPPLPPPELLDPEPNRSDTPFGCAFVLPGMEMENV